MRKYKNEYKEIIQVLNSSLDYITEKDSKVIFNKDYILFWKKVALIWILGEFGEFIDDSPYILENLINGLKENKSVNNEEKDKDNLKVKHTVILKFILNIILKSIIAFNIIIKIIHEKTTWNAKYFRIII